MKTSFSCLVSILGLSAACSGGSGTGSADLTAPAIALTFPPPVSFTDEDSITVTGTASDPSGVAEVRVNGVLASTSDRFATWQARVPLVPGTNTLIAGAGDSLGNADWRAAECRIESQALLLRPAGIVVDPSRQVAFVLDGSAVVAVDLWRGVRTTVSDGSRGAGPLLNAPSGIALGRDRALVVDRGPPASVIAIDLAKGDREILSDASHGTGPSLDGPLAITVDGQRALVTSDHPPALFAVDLASGDRTILSSTAVGGGPTFRTPVGIVLDGGRALVVDGYLQALLAVDLAAGDRTIVSNADTGTGQIFSQVTRGIALEGIRALVADPGEWWWGSGSGAVFAIDLPSGDRTILAAPFGLQTDAAPTAIALDETDWTRALVADPCAEEILGVDLASGERTTVSPRTSVGSGPSFRTGAIALEGDRFLVEGREAFLVSVDLATGDRAIVSDASTGSGPDFVNVGAVVVDGSRALVVAQHVLPQFPVAVFAVDLASGDRSIVSDSSRGEGPAFDHYAKDIALAGRRALVADDRVLLGVDLASGDRTIVSGWRTGQGPSFQGLSAIVVDGDRAIVLDNDDCSSSVVEVDLATGDRTILSQDYLVGEGPNWKDLTDLVLDGERVLVGRAPWPTIYAVDLSTGNRTILMDGEIGEGPGFYPEELVKSGDRLWLADPDLEAIMAVDLRSGQRAIVAR